MTSRIHTPRLFIGPGRAAADQRLSALEFRILAILGTYTDREGWCWPSQKLLADGSGAARPTVSTALQKLQKLGYIEITPRLDGPRGKVGNMYLVKLDPKATSDGAHPMSAEDDIGKSDIGTAPSDVIPSGHRKTARPMSSPADIAKDEGPQTQTLLPTVGESEVTGSTPAPSAGLGLGAVYEKLGGALPAGPLPPLSPEKPSRRSGGKKSTASSAKPRVPLNEAWPLSEKGRAFARERGFDDGQIESMFARFREYHLMHDSRFADWSAAWRTWVLRQMEMIDERNRQGRQQRAPAGGAGSGDGRYGGGSSVSAMRELTRRVRERENELSEHGHS